MKIVPNYNEDVVRTVFSLVENEVVLEAITAAGYFADEAGYFGPQSADDVQSSGRFVIPLVLPEGVESGDGRSFEEMALALRNLPLPLMWQIKTGTGHDGAVIVGRIDSIERVPGGMGNARGVFDLGGVFGREAERLVRQNFLRGISADLDEFEGYSLEEDEPDLDAKELADKGLKKKSNRKEIKSKQITVESARVMGVTLVAKPAFQECFIMLEDDPSLSVGDEFMEDGLYEDLMDDADDQLAALAASAAPVVPPREWFNDPKLSGPTPLTIDDDGRVFGHIASWNVDHIGYSRGQKPPRSASKYAYFRTGLVRTDDGSDVPVGQITLAGGHAPMSASAAEAVKHYDDTMSAMCDVAAGEDRYGIWVSGALRPDVTPSQVRAFRASAPSGDWRPIGRRLELVAVCAVNVPGFPQVRTMVAGGQLTALVAAGTAPLLALREETSLSTLEERIARLENSGNDDLTAKAAELSARMAQFGFNAPVEEEKTEDPAAVVASARERMAALLPVPSAEINVVPDPKMDSDASQRAIVASLAYRMKNLHL